MRTGWFFTELGRLRNKFNVSIFFPVRHAWCVPIGGGGHTYLTALTEQGDVCKASSTETGM